MIINDNLEMILLFLHKNLCCGCSLESLQRGDSNEHPQHRFEKYYLSIIIKYHQIRTLYYIPVLNKLQGIYCTVRLPVPGHFYSCVVSKYLLRENEISFSLL